MVNMAAVAVDDANAHVFGPGSKPANPRDVTHCDRDDCPWASTVSFSMSISTHSPAANGNAREKIREPDDPTWVMVKSEHGPSTRATTGPVRSPSLVMLICPVCTTELMLYGTVNGTVRPPVADGSGVASCWVGPNLRESAAVNDTDTVP